jgi:hypothetical protein
MDGSPTSSTKRWACGTCTKPCGITEPDLVEGAHIATAANVVERMAEGAVTLDF